MPVHGPAGSPARRARARRQSLDVASVLRGLPRALAATPPVAFALRAWAALRAGDWPAVLRLHAAGDCAQRALLAPRLRQARPGLPTLHATLGALRVLSIRVGETCGARC